MIQHVHFADCCPHSEEREEEIHITPLQSQSDIAMDLFAGETLGMTILDRECAKTVCGKTWINAYLETLSERKKLCGGGYIKHKVLLWRWYTEFPLLNAMAFI